MTSPEDGGWLGKNRTYLSSVRRLTGGGGLLCSLLLLYLWREWLGENVLLEIFLSKSHIIGKSFGGYKISFLDLSMKHNLSDLPKITL